MHVHVHFLVVVQHRERDAMHFTELHRRLKSQVNTGSLG